MVKKYFFPILRLRLPSSPCYTSNYIAPGSSRFRSLADTSGFAKFKSFQLENRQPNTWWFYWWESLINWVLFWANCCNLLFIKRRHLQNACFWFYLISFPDFFKNSKECWLKKLSPLWPVKISPVIAIIIVVDRDLIGAFIGSLTKEMPTKESMSASDVAVFNFKSSDAEWEK